MKITSSSRAATFRLMLSVGVSLVAIGAVAPAQALSAAPAAEAAPQVAEEGVVGLQEIVVTAQKRAENLQNVPIAVTAVGANTLSAIHATSLQSLQGVVPSVQLNNYVNTPAVAAFYIRGMGILEADPYAGQTVSIVVDGVPQYFSMGALLDTFDLDRVEVLRGPQGTLFGANTTGGVVNVVTKQPTGEWGGRLEATYGNWNRFDLLGSLDFPLIDGVLAGKVVWNHTERKGWVTNIVDGSSMGDRNHDDIRAFLKLTPSDNFDATLMVEYDNGRDGAPIVVNGGVPGEALYVPAGTTFPNSQLPMYQSPCVSLTQKCKAPNKYYSANDSVRDVSKLDSYFGVLTMNLRDTPIGDITSITGYKHIKLFEQTDQDGTPAFLLDTSRNTTLWQFSQELRSSVDITDRINLVYGGFYLRDHYDHIQSLRLPYALPGVRQDNPQESSNYSLSAFAQSYIQLTDQLRLQAGIRYTHERTKLAAAIERFSFASGVAEFEGGTPFPAGSFSASGKKSWNNVGWKLGLDFKVDQSRLLYAYWARGFKSGGFTGRLGIPQDIGPYDPEHVDTYEAGIKADWFNRRLRTNLALFYTNYRDMQLSQQYFTTDANGLFVQGNTILNVASAHIKGVEFDGSAVLFPGFTVNGSFTYLDAKYKKFPFLEISVIGSTVRDLSGFRLQNSPKWAASMGATYEFPLGPGKMTVNGQYNYTGQKFLTSQVDAPRSIIQPTHLVNANIDWSPDGANWSIGVWGTNLLDKRYNANVFDFPGTFAFASYAPPREWGGTVRYHW
nr:TonB-dependent receptor [Sphingomonas sp. Y57]